MTLLRLLSFLICLCIPLLPPLLLAADSTRGLPGRSVLGGVLGTSLVCAAFLYVAVLAPRMRRALVLRILGGVLLLVPAVIGVVMMCSHGTPAVMLVGALLFAAAILMFSGFVFPAAPDRRQRPMRRRERQEPALS